MKDAILTTDERIHLEFGLWVKSNYPEMLDAYGPKDILVDLHFTEIKGLRCKICKMIYSDPENALRHWEQFHTKL